VRQEGGSANEPGGGAVARPAVAVVAFARKRDPLQVQDDVARALEQVALTLDEQGAVATAEEMPGAPMAAVEVLGVDPVQLAHGAGEVGHRRLDEQVEVVLPQAVGVAEPAEAGADAFQALEPEPAVAVVAHDRLALVAARRHVVEGAGNSRRRGRAIRVKPAGATGARCDRLGAEGVATKDLTPGPTPGPCWFEARF
jgi:hypothetical protein